MIKRPKKTLKFNPVRAQTLLDELIASFKKHRPTVGEIIVVLGNLCYNLGHAVGNHGDKTFNPDELQQKYMENPGAIDIALMSQGLIMTAWYDTWLKEKTKIAKQ